MIVIDAMDLIFPVIVVVLLLLCGVVRLIDGIAMAIQKRQQKRIDEAYKYEERDRLD